MPPKKIKPEVEKIEYMNVPLKSGFRYATEDEAIKANKILLWGKFSVPMQKLKENEAILKAPNRLTRAKELRPDFVLAGVKIKERGAKGATSESKAMKKYDKNYDYQIEDLPVLEKFSDAVDKKMDNGDDSDEINDLQADIYDDIARLKGLQKIKGTSLVNSRSTLAGGSIPKAIITPQHKAPRAVGGKFEKEHGLGTIVQAYFYIYFGPKPPKKGRTNYRPATAEEAVNNKMVSLYGVHKIPETIDKQGQMVGHAGNIKAMNKTQLQTIYAGMRGKRSKILKDFEILVFKANNTGDSGQYEQEMNKLDEQDYEIAKMQLKLLNALNKLDGKPKITKMDRNPLKYEKIEEVYHPKPTETVKVVKSKSKMPKHTEHHENVEIVQNAGPQNKEYHIFSNDTDKIQIPYNYFNENQQLKTDKASKLRLKNVILHPHHYQEKDISKFFYEKHSTGRGIAGGKINAKSFFNKIGSTVSSVGHTIDNGLTSAYNYAGKVLHGVEDYLKPVREIINKYSNNTISGVMIGRAPVPGAITGALNMVSGGTFKEGMNTQPYDKLFHLFLYLTLNDNTKLLFEKNATINTAVNSPLPPETETLQIKLPNTTTTLNTFLQNGQNKMGKDYFIYDPHYNNCQDYIMGLLTANGWGTQEDYNWIKQDTGALFANNKYLGTVARKVTDFGGVVDRVFKGVGFNDKSSHIQSILFKRPEWTEALAGEWLKDHKFKDDVDIKPEHLRYRQIEPNENKYDYRTKNAGNNIEFLIGYKK